jgi:hypothetical protein
MTTTESPDLIARARRVLEEIFPADDEAALVELLSPEMVNHEAPPGTPPGPGSVAWAMHMLAGAFSDQTWTVQRAVAAGDTVALHYIHSGRHTGEFFGLPPTGRRFAYPQMHMIRFQDGLGVEHWAVRDDASLMRQLTGAAAE